MKLSAYANKRPQLGELIQYKIYLHKNNIVLPEMNKKKHIKSDEHKY